MKTWIIAGRAGTVACATALAAAILLCGCPSNREKKPKSDVVTNGPGSQTVPNIKPEPPPPALKKVEPSPKPAKAADKPGSRQEALTEDVEQMAEKPRDLGQPLVDDPDNLVPLSREQPIWVDKKSRQVVLLGEVCDAGHQSLLLEFFATYSNRAYESVLAVNVKPRLIHTGLVAVGAEPGHPARFQPEFSPPTGTEIAIEVRWKDRQGKVQSARAQDWIRNVKTKKALDVNWVFAGSIEEKDENGQITSYMADGGDMICVLSLPSAMLDLPMHGSRDPDARSFEAFAEHLPPTGTPVTLLLKPILPAKPAAGPAGKKAAKQDPAEAEKKAAEAAAPWLALVDQGEYSRSWETAAEFLKDAIERRDFVKKVGEARKPLGKLISRAQSAAEYTTTLPGAPDGQYVVLRFKTVFEKKAAAVETAYVMLDKDKKWRVSGYYIK